MIVAVSLNPALDVTYRLDRPLRLGATNRVADVAVRPGGKALNVARVVRQLGRPVCVVAPVGGASGETLQRGAGLLGLTGSWVRVAGETRRTVVSWDAGSGVATTLSEPGAALDANDWSAILRAVEDSLPAEAMVVSGSVAQGLPVNAIAQLVAMAQTVHTPAVVDTSTLQVSGAIDAGAAIVKPNRHELETVLGRSIGPGTRKLADGAEALRAGRDVAVVVSDGPDGLVATTSRGSWVARPPVLVGNATGAGDACVAGLVCGLVDGDRWPDMVRTAAALGAAAVRQPLAGEIGSYDDLLAATAVEQL